MAYFFCHNIECDTFLTTNVSFVSIIRPRAQIYDKLRPLGLNERSIQSIEDVTNPLLNSINEKCARIRGAFLEQFDEHLAKNYFITGKRGEAKKITLPRNLVVWE